MVGLDRGGLDAAVAEHGAIVRVVIAAHAGSAPRETGTAMLVWTGGQAGTIGGGALEWEAAKRARDLLASGRREGARPSGQLLKLPLGPSLGQCCGGTVSLLLEYFDADAVLALPDGGVFARAIDSDTETAPLWVQKAQREARAGAWVTPHMKDGWFVEPLAATATPLWIHGAGHVGRAIVGTLAGLPFAVTWVDTDPTRFPDPLPAHATRLVAARPQDAVAYAPPDAIHLVLTYSHEIDLSVCHAVLSRRFAHLGLIGSATKKARFLKRLADLGHPPERLARLTCPIGDPALGKHPQAIAVGVVAELLNIQAAGRAASNRGQSA